MSLFNYMEERADKEQKNREYMYLVRIYQVLKDLGVRDPDNDKLGVVDNQDIYENKKKKNVIKLTEAQLRDHIQKIISEQSSKYQERDSKRIEFFDNLSKQISSKIVGKTYPFGKIGVLDNTSITVIKYMDRNHSIDLSGEPINELNLFFGVKRNQEDLYKNEKPGTRVWTGAIQVSAKFVNGKLLSNPMVELWGMKNGKIDFSLDASVPSKPWTWEMVGGSELWSKAKKFEFSKPILEQTSSLKEEESVGGKRPHDKMVMDCLTKAGFKSGNTKGKYELYMTKRIKSTSGDVVYIVSSQQDPTTFATNTVINDKVTSRGSFQIGTSTNCNEIVKKSTQN